VLFSVCVGLAWVMLKRVVDLLERKSLEDGSGLLWCFWRKRNYRSFEDNEKTMAEL